MPQQPRRFRGHVQQASPPDGSDLREQGIQSILLGYVDDMTHLVEAR